MTGRARWVVIALMVAWAVLSACLVGALAIEQVVGCPSSGAGDSDYGQPSWQWLPPGNTCTYVADADPTTHRAPVTHPSDWRVVVLALMVAWPAAVAVGARRHARKRGTPALRGAHLIDS